MLPDDPRDIRAPKSASTSSKNTTQGERRRAREKTALTLCNKKKEKVKSVRKRGGGGLYVCTTYSFSPSPTYISFTSLGWMASILAPLSAATALARRVLPVPGGPKSKAPVVA